jgi:hypothetical protein
MCEFSTGSLTSDEYEDVEKTVATMLKQATKKLQ